MRRPNGCRAASHASVALTGQAFRSRQLSRSRPAVPTIGETERRLVAYLLLDRKVVSVVHRSLEIPYDLDHVEGRGRCDALSINVHAGSHANEIRTKRVGGAAAIENGLVVRRRRADADGEDALRHLAEESGPGSAPHLEVGLGSMDGAKVWQVVTQRIAGAQHGPAFAEYVPGKSGSAGRSCSCPGCKADGWPGSRTRRNRPWDHPARSWHPDCLSHPRPRKHPSELPIQL